MPVIGPNPFARRDFLAGAAALGVMAVGTFALPGLALAADAGDPIRRLLELATQNTLNRLGQPNGFVNSRVAHFGLPVLFIKRGGAPAGTLATSAFRELLIQRLNVFAEAGARGAVPVMMQAARALKIADPAAVLRGSPTAATSLLRLDTGSGLVNALVPPIEAALTAAQDPAVTQAIAQLPGVTLHDVAHAVALAADNGIWYEIGATEADIRAHPEATNDAVLIAALRAPAAVPAPIAGPARQPGL
jgi:hypothetical protein